MQLIVLSYTTTASVYCFLSPFVSWHRILGPIIDSALFLPANLPRLTMILMHHQRKRIFPIHPGKQARPH